VLGAGLGDAAEVDELGEEALEPGGRDDLEDPAGLVAGVPERMPLSPRLVNEIPWSRFEVLVTQ